MSRTASSGRIIVTVLIGLFLSTLSVAAVPLQPSPAVDQATVEALATRYTFAAVEGRDVGCVVRLKAAPAQTKGRIGRPVEINRRCRNRFRVLRNVARWEPTGGGSIRLLGGRPYRELSDFSPVQDATGVYLRGGFEGHKAIYELRPPQ